MNEIKTGDVVCLIFDEGKRFLVESDILIDGKIRVLYFNEVLGRITSADIEPQYLSVVQKRVSRKSVGK